MDLEARVHSEHPQALRLWLRMLTCTQLIEKRVRVGLRDEFNTTLPRFDLMAQLERVPEGMKMNALSRRMMVTGGNITPVTDQLVREGLVERLELAHDRRAWLIRLTPAGRWLPRGLWRSGRRAFAACLDLCFATFLPGFLHICSSARYLLWHHVLLVHVKQSTP